MISSRYIWPLVLALACLAVPLGTSAQQEDAPRDAVQQEEASPQTSPAPAEVAPAPDRRRWRDDGRQELRDPVQQSAERDPAAHEPEDPADHQPEPVFQATQEEWQRAMTFMNEYAPKRTAMLADLPEEFQHAYRERFYMRFRELERLKGFDRDLYDIRVRRISAEDEVDAIRHGVRWRGKTLTPQDVVKLREAVVALVDLHLEERELRVQRLREILARESEMLSRDRAQREATIAETVAAVEQGQRGGILGGFGRGYGRGGPDGLGGPGGLGGSGGPGGGPGGPDGPRRPPVSP